MVVVEDCIQEIVQAIYDYINDGGHADAAMLYLAVGTGTATDEGPTNTALDAIVVGSCKLLSWTFDANVREMAVEIIFGFGPGDVEGSDQNTNGQTLTEMAIYNSDVCSAPSTMLWRHRFNAFAKSTANRFKIEIVVKIAIDDT